MGENTGQKISEYEHFSYSEYLYATMFVSPQSNDSLTIQRPNFQHIVASQLIYNENQLTGFYFM